MKNIPIIFLFFLSSLLGFSQGSSFVFTNSGTNAQIDTALNFTGRIWGKFLNSSVPVKINIYYTNLGAPSNLAITIPNGRKDFSNAPMDSVWYPSSLANSLAGTELNPGEADMDIYVNSSTNWYLDTLGNPGASQYDFVTVMLHEMGHGLAFLSLAKFDSNNYGSFGMVTSADIAPLTSSFPFPQLEGKPSVFAMFMENGTGQLLTDTTLFPNNSLLLGDEFIGNDLYFDGPIANTFNGNLPVRLYAPSSYLSGASTQHLNESTYSSSNLNSLMTPYINTQEVHHHPGDLTVAMMEDMGWNVNYIAGIREEEKNRFTVYPNPASDWIVVYPQTNKGKVDFFDIHGRNVKTVIFNSVAPIHINVSDLSRGTYLMELNSELSHSVAKLILQ